MKLKVHSSYHVSSEHALIRGIERLDESIEFFTHGKPRFTSAIDWTFQLERVRVSNSTPRTCVNICFRFLSSIPPLEYPRIDEAFSRAPSNVLNMTGSIQLKLEGLNLKLLLT